MNATGTSYERAQLATLYRDLLMSGHSVKVKFISPVGETHWLDLDHDTYRKVMQTIITDAEKETHQ
jgi:hypothetical protein